MRNSFIKILVVLVIIGLNWSGLSAVIQTVAYYLDNEGGPGNTFTAGTLDMKLSDTSGGDLPEKLFDIASMQKGQTETRTVRVTKADGSLDFQYNITISSSGDLCNSLTLSAKLDGNEYYNLTVQNGSIIPIPPAAAINYSGPNDDWTFTLTLSGSAPENETCNFDLVFDGVQIDGAGFSDEEFLSSNVISGTWQTCKLWTTESDFNAGTKSDVVVFTDGANGGDGDVKLTSTPSSGTITLVPNQDGDHIALSKNGSGGSNYDRVTTNDGDTTYVYSSDSAERYDLYNLEDTTQTETINSVTVHANMRASSSPSSSSGPNNAGTGADVNAGGGTITWSSPTNIQTVGSPYATASVSSSATTHYLQGSNYGFVIPTGANITGITVTINRYSSSGTNRIKDSRVSLVKAVGGVQTTNKAVTGNWPTSLGTATYGGDLWGTAWTAAEINDLGFGVVLSAVNASSLSTRTATVDYMSITVNYSMPVPQGRVYLKTNNQEDMSTWTDLGTTYGETSKTWTTNPITHTDWSWTDINALQAGVGFQNAADGARATQVWVDVNYPTTTYVASGAITSQQYDKGGITKWTTLEWDKIPPSGATSVGTEIRFSNDNLHWSSWYTVPSNFDISNRPSAQYIQWRATLSTSNNTQTPILQEVRACYSQPSTTTLNDIKLNEFLPNPQGVEYGWDFGNDGDSKPKGEWVELYNNGASAVDLAGWQISDSDGNSVTIDSAHVLSGTVIGPRGSGSEWLVVYMNKEMFDNGKRSCFLFWCWWDGGDTVNVIDPYGVNVDHWDYDVSGNACDLEPTPGGGNDNPASGSCSEGVPPNKSYARIPDGTDSWFDPIPTPGRQNELEEVVLEDEQTLEEEPIEENEEEEIISEEEITEEEIIEEEAPNEEETPVEEELLTEENQEEGIVDKINNTIEEMVSGLFEEIIPDEATNEEPATEEISVVDETSVVEEIPNTEETIIEETPIIDESTIIEENQEEGIVDEIVDGIVEEILPETEPANEEQASEEPAEEITPTEETIIEVPTETPANEEQTVVEDSSEPLIEENTPAIEEQPPVIEEQSVDVPNNNSDDQNVSAESSGDGGDSGGNGDNGSGDSSGESSASETSADSGSSGESVSQ